MSRCSAKLIALGTICVVCDLGSSRAWGDEPLQAVGLGARALPALVRVGVATPVGPGWAAAATAGYGWIPSLGTVPGSHHRMHGTLAGAVGALPWLDANLSLDGRYDLHPRDSSGRDSSAVGEPRLGLRASRRIHPGFGLGGEMEAWFVGGDAPSLRPEATTLEVRMLLSWFSLDQSQVVAALLGWRFDQSAASVDDPATLRPGDRISLGVSEFDALLLGVGVSKRLGRTELVGELTSDCLLGPRAPRPDQSPWRMSVGIRQHASRNLSLEAVTGILLGGRPPVGPSQPLAPIEPRLWISFGLRYQKTGQPEPQAEPATKLTLPSGADQQPRPPERVGPPASPQPITLQGRVTDGTGQGVEGALVRLELGYRTLEQRTDAEGRFRISDLLAGEYRLVVEAPGYVRLEQKLGLSSSSEVELALEPALPAGQLRGLVRSLHGEPVRARITIEPANRQVETDLEGRFEVDLSPGSYTVVIEADGYRSQRRKVKVENRGVTVINAELEVRPRDNRP